MPCCTQNYILNIKIRMLRLEIRKTILTWLLLIPISLQFWLDYCWYLNHSISRECLWYLIWLRRTLVWREAMIIYHKNGSTWQNLTSMNIPTKSLIKSWKPAFWYDKVFRSSLLNDFKTLVHSDPKSVKFLTQKFLLDDKYLKIYLRQKIWVLKTKHFDFIAGLASGTYLKQWMFWPNSIPLE